MATMKALIKSILSGDSALSSTLTGGVEDVNDWDIGDDGANDAPRDDDGVTLLPHAKIRWRSADAFGPFQIQAERQSVEIYVYQDNGYSTIDSAVRRIKALLHDKYLHDADDRLLVHLRHAFTSGELVAIEYGYAPMAFIRFSVITA